MVRFVLLPYTAPFGSHIYVHEEQLAYYQRIDQNMHLNDATAGLVATV